MRGDEHHRNDDLGPVLGAFSLEWGDRGMDGGKKEIDIRKMGQIWLMLSFGPNNEGITILGIHPGAPAEALEKARSRAEEVRG